jgi:hypothetical protein
LLAPVGILTPRPGRCPTASRWWCGSGTIITRSRGTPHVGDVFLGALGVVIAYGALQFLGRLAPARNNQKIGVTMADDYRLGAVAQLGERLAGSQKVRGSSPLSSTGPKAA